MRCSTEYSWSSFLISPYVFVGVPCSNLLLRRLAVVSTTMEVGLDRRADIADAHCALDNGRPSGRVRIPNAQSRTL